MDNTLQTSFIPKQMGISPRPSSSTSSGGMGLFTLLSFIILILSGVIAGGAYGYKLYLQNYLYGKCAQTGSSQGNPDSLGLAGEVDRQCGLYLSLENKRQRLSPERLARMEKLDTKMKLATLVLKRHMSLVPLFDLLGTSTLKTIRYTKFESKGSDVTLSGVASSYEDIAVQSNLLNKMPEIKSSLFSDLDLDQKGNVTFNLKFQVNPSYFEYKGSSAETISNNI